MAGSLFERAITALHWRDVVREYAVARNYNRRTVEEWALGHKYVPAGVWKDILEELSEHEHVSARLVAEVRAKLAAEQGRVGRGYLEEDKAG